MLNRTKSSSLVWAAVVFAFCALVTISYGQTNDLLLDLLVKKGFVTQDEAEKLKGEAASLQSSNNTSFTKWKISDGIKSIELFGDMRMRYEARRVFDPSGGRIDLDRFRYALRIGLRGDLASGFYYGLRLETASNPRSPWVTFGLPSSTSSAPYQGPFGKSAAGIDIGQIYLGWRPINNIDITVGKMANPLFTTPMVWDTDISPEGAAEHFKYDIGPAQFFATFGQFIYQDDNPSTSTLGLYGGNDLGHNGNPPFMMAWQGGLNYQITTNVSFKAAGTLYNYLGHGTNGTATATPGTPDTGYPGFSDIYVGEGSGIPVVGASGYPSGSAAGFTYNQSGINDLLVMEFPFEVNFKIYKHPAKFFGDFSENLAGTERAEAAVEAASHYTTPLHIPLHKNQNKAYQVGFAFGNDDALGLVYGTTLRRSDWEARVYWQHIEQYALDPNLIDSDFFEGRGNLEGVYASLAYGFTSAVIGTARIGYATRIDRQLGTGGDNQDIPQMNPINRYQLVQLDLTMKF